MHLERTLAELGGVAHLSRLAAAGWDAAAVRNGVRGGRLRRIRRGWVALPTAPAEVVSAVRVGGALSCLSLLRARGVWCIDDRLLHVRANRHTAHLASPTDRGAPLDAMAHRVRVHRSLTRSNSGEFVALDSVEDALMQLVICQPRDVAVAAFDSALALRVTDRTRLRMLAEGLTQKHREVLALADAGSASGLETKARLRLRALGIPYRTQVLLPPAGRVDLLIGDRLVIELDGKKWHSSEAASENDRGRDLALVEQGHIVWRFSYQQVMFEWERIEAAVRAVVARGEHRWSARQLRDGCGSPAGRRPQSHPSPPGHRSA